MGTAIKHPVPDQVKQSFVIFDIRALWTLCSECQSARMSKITNDGLTRSGNSGRQRVNWRQKILVTRQLQITNCNYWHCNTTVRLI